MIEDARGLQPEAGYEPESPFAPAMMATAAPGPGPTGPVPWRQGLSPFADDAGRSTSASRSNQMFAEIFSELRDEGFDDALAYLAEETEHAVADRFTNEMPASVRERERYADAHLAAVRNEARHYLETLETGVAAVDVQSLADDELDQLLERFEPVSSELTPAGEEFIGAFARKARNALKKAAKAASSVAKTAQAAVGTVAGGLWASVLGKLKGLIDPLLKRVLSFAIGRLPAQLQPAARTLAARFLPQAGAASEGLDEQLASPTTLTDVEALAEEFDAALAEAVIGEGGVGADFERFDGEEGEAPADSRALETLAEARGALIDRIRGADDEENLGPAIEQFVPALLAALRLGMNLVGRPKVVSFLAGYLARLIQKWVGPNLSGPLSSAIVDTGLRLISLEAEGEDGVSSGGEAGAVALASVVEDTVRRLAENETYIFENDALTELAAADAFGEAVATHFPSRFVRPDLRQAPSLGGTFVARRPRGIRTYRKYSRIPEVEVTAQVADALPTFGGSTLGAVLRAAGASFPVRARMHIYQSAVGTTLPGLVRQDRSLAGGGRGYVTSTNVHPLTPAAAGFLLREPRLGVASPAAYLRSRRRIAAGQRFYLLEPLGAAGALAFPSGAISRETAARLAPSRAWTSVNLRRSRITVGLYLSEPEAQGIAAAVRQGRGGGALLQALTAAYRTMDGAAPGPAGGTAGEGEDGEEFEQLATRARRALPPEFRALLRGRLRAWVLPALADWAKTNGEAFARAAAHPDAGVTVRVALSSVPGLDLLRQAAAGGPAGAAAGATADPGNALRGTPTIAVTVASGRRRR